ncbi:DUF3189 family protein [Syntrophomonas palmitatica]|uniref:DUF3189 family protein n=1 Tax=Syntrophomonas palmitatica TaxID=402877 RepID=UPI0006CF7FC9|nr:DUF3189 family protein [Syntrophomonas palmitatica]
MKIIYHCFGGSHSSVIASALHLGLIDKNRLPSMDEMMALPYFDKTSKDDFGSIRFVGKDEFDNEIYVLGKKGFGNRFSALLEGVAEILGVSGQVMAVDCMNRVNLFMKLGGFTSRRVGMANVGRPVLGKGTREAFFDLVNLVEITRLKVLNINKTQVQV